MLTAPIAATAHALRRAGMTLDQIDLVEINEAFATVVLAWQRETGADPATVNVSGGAIALGHPLGATGARLLTTLLLRAGADRRPVRAADDVRGRRPGQRDHHRAPVTFDASDASGKGQGSGKVGLHFVIFWTELVTGIFGYWRPRRRSRGWRLGVSAEGCAALAEPGNAGCYGLPPRVVWVLELRMVTGCCGLGLRGRAKTAGTQRQGGYDGTDSREPSGDD